MPFQSRLHIGHRLLPDRRKSPTDLQAFQRDGRHFLKQLANRIGLKDDYSIIARHAGPDHPGEVVLRSGSLLLVVEDVSRTEGANLAWMRIAPGVTVPDSEKKRVRIAELAPEPALRELIAELRGLVAGAAKE